MDHVCLSGKIYPMAVLRGQGTMGGSIGFWGHWVQIWGQMWHPRLFGGSYDLGGQVNDCCRKYAHEYQGFKSQTIFISLLLASLKGHCPLVFSLDIFGLPFLLAFFALRCLYNANLEAREWGVSRGMWRKRKWPWRPGLGSMLEGSVTVRVCKLSKWACSWSMWCTGRPDRMSHRKWR